MHKNQITIGGRYRQVRAGEHKGMEVVVTNIGPNNIEYSPEKNRGFRGVKRQRVSIDRFCVMFENV